MWLVLLFPLVLASHLAAAARDDWHVEFPPVKIAGNLYYVGTADLAIFLIHTPRGNILKEKFAKAKAGGTNPFIDPSGYRDYVTLKEAAFRTEWARQKEN